MEGRGGGGRAVKQNRSAMRRRLSYQRHLADRNTMAGVDPAAEAGRARRLPSVTPTKASSLHVDVISLSGADGNIGNLWPTAPPESMPPLVC